MNLIKRTASKARRLVGKYRAYRRLQHLLRAAAVPGARPDQVFGHVEDDHWFWLNTEGYRRHPELRAILPSMPDEQTQMNFTGNKGDLVMEEGYAFYRLVKGLYEKHRGHFADCKDILDFGSGWGRMLRFFLKDKEPFQLRGIDISEEMVSFCHRSNKWCRFDLIEPVPPTTLPDEAFDLIYAYSVFSHLSEDVHDKWLAEFRRILKPEGLLVATTRARDFIEYCEQLRNDPNLHTYADGVKNSAIAFPDTKQALADYDSGQYCFTSYGVEGRWSFFGDTAIPKGYVLEHWTRYFQSLEYIDDQRVVSQNIIVVKK